jgi:rhodanese-related sulfurtransferase
MMKNKMINKNPGRVSAACILVLIWVCALLYSHEVYTKGKRVRTSRIRSEAVKTITAMELKDLMDTDENLIVINVLRPESYANCHIPGSINIPGHELHSKTHDWNRDQKIVVYCASYECPAGQNAYNRLINLGFTNVLEYPGGIKEWFEMGLETEGPCQFD